VQPRRSLESLGILGANRSRLAFDDWFIIPDATRWVFRNRLHPTLTGEPNSNPESETDETLDGDPNSSPDVGTVTTSGGGMSGFGRGGGERGSGSNERRGAGERDGTRSENPRSKSGSGR